MVDSTRNSQTALSRADTAVMSTTDFAPLAGRILLGLIFVRSGYGKLFDISHVAAGFPARGIPYWMAWVAVPVEFFGGLAIILGFATRLAAPLMIAFTLVASFTSHDYWNVTDAARRTAQDINFWKNIAIIGGFLSLYAAGAGRYSVDALLRRR